MSANVRDLLDGAGSVGGAMRWIPPELGTWGPYDTPEPVKRFAVRAWLVAYLRRQRAARRARVARLAALTRHSSGRRR